MGVKTMDDEKSSEAQRNNSESNFPQTEPIRTGDRASRSRIRRFDSQKSSRSQSRASRASKISRTHSPVFHRVASHYDDHGGYFHEHTAGYEDAAVEAEELASEESLGSDGSKGKEEVEERSSDEHGGSRDEEKGLEGGLERKSTNKSVKDPNLVTWDGPDDPANPKNWTTKRKWAATFVVSSFTFISPVASSMVAPALSTIAADFGITNQVESQLVLSIFILAYAVGPLFLGPLSELFGRVIVLQLANAFYFVFNLACGFSQNKAEIIVFRFLSGLGGSAPLSVGGGVLGDCWLSHERGKAIAVYSLMPLLGPAIGPIAGGFITENTTWRWAFWATSAACGAIQLIGIFFLQETYGPQILHRKKVALIKETGNKDLYTEFDSRGKSVTTHIRGALQRPFKLLFTQPIVQVLALYIAYVYGLVYLVLSTFPQLWSSPEYYNESIGIGGLNYISLGIGYWLGSQICAPLNDRIYRRLKRRNNDVGKSEFRIPLMVPGSLIMPIGLFWYGWTAQTHQHWILPNIGAVIYSVGAIMIFQCVQTYIVDAYTQYAASALAATVVLRSLCGFAFPLFAPYMYDALGFGWGNSVLGFVALAIGIPAPILLWKFGERLRSRGTYAQGG